MSDWQVGDLCTLVCLNVRDGSDPIKPGVIESVHGHHVVVATDDGGRYSAEVDSSFLKHRAKA